MEGAPQISVVVATRNRADRLAGLLRSLAGQTIDPGSFEVIVVDDGSTDETPQLLAAESGRGTIELTSIRRSGNGPAAARNAGWRAARSPLVAFTDDDCEATPDWLEQAIAAAHVHPGKIVQGPTTPIPSELERTGPFTRTKIITEPNPSFQTCNIVYPRELLESLEGFDEGFPEALGEDTDLGWRAKEVGVDLHWTELLRMHHAVDDLGPVGYLRTALRGVDQTRIFRRHPELRAELRWGLIRHAAMPGLILLTAGLIVARRSPTLGALLALPYARHLIRTCSRQRASFLFVPYYAVWDLLVAYTALRGSLRYRTLVL